MRWWPKSVTLTLRVLDPSTNATLPVSIQETVQKSEGPRSTRPETVDQHGDEKPPVIQLNPVAGKLIRYSRGDPQAARLTGSPSRAASPPRVNSGFAHLFRASLLLVVLGGALTLTSPARAASITWTGLGSTNDWSEGANWSTGVAPGPGDVAIFDATSSKNATINVAANVSGIQISVGYTGTIT